MGPFPHDAPVATISKENPAGTDGFEFVEFSHPEPEKLEELFTRMGYKPVARHRTKNITLWRQGDINYILNAEPNSHATKFVGEHGPCAPSMAWRVVDAKHAFDHAVAKGATPYTGDDKTIDVPAIVGIGGSMLYFIEKYGEKGSVYEDEFEWLGERDPKPQGVGSVVIEELEKYDDYKIMILPDHPTPLVTMTHARDPVPFMIYHKNGEKNGVETVNENTAKSTGIYFDSGVELMKYFLGK